MSFWNIKQFRQIFILVFMLVFSTGNVFGQSNEAFEKEMSFYQLEDMANRKVTTASKFEEKQWETPSTMYIITEQKIQDRGYTDIVQIFHDVPGMDVMVLNGATYSNIYVRGNPGEVADRCLFFVNGMNFQSLGFQTMDLSRDIPMTSIKQIEVLYGPSSAIYGSDAFSGIINVITKTPRDLKAGENQVAFDIGYGSYMTMYGDVTYVNRISEDLGVFVSSRYFKSDEPNFSDRKGFFSNEIINKAWKPMLSEYGRGYSDPSKDYSIFTSVFYKFVEVGFNRKVLSEGSGPQYPLDKTMPSPQWENFRNLAFAKFDPDLGKKIRSNTTFSFKDGDTPEDTIWVQRYDADEDGVQDNNLVYWQFYNREYSISEGVVWKPSNSTTINGGLNYKDLEFQKGYQNIFGPGIPETEDTYPFSSVEKTKKIVPSESKYGMKAAGSYLQVKQGFLDNNLFLVPGIRYDYNSIYENKFNPRIGTVYQFSKKYIAKINYGTGYQYPSPRNLYGNWTGTEVNKDLKPEEIQAFDSQVLFPLSRYVSNSIGGFYNIIDKSNLLGINLPKRTVYGAEYNLETRIRKLSEPFTNFSVFANYTFTDSTYESKIENMTTQRSSDAVNNIADHKLNLGFGTDIMTHFRFDVRSNFVNERPIIVSSPVAKTQAYFVTNLSFQIKDVFTKGITLSLLANNIFNSDYYHPGVSTADAGEDTSVESLGWYSSRIPQPKRHFMITVKGRF